MDAPAIEMTVEDLYRRNIGALLRRWRDQEGLTQAAAIERLGPGATALAMYEAERRNPSDQTRNLIARALGADERLLEAARALDPDRPAGDPEFDVRGPLGRAFADWFASLPDTVLASAPLRDLGPRGTVEPKTSRAAAAIGGVAAVAAGAGPLWSAVRAQRRAAEDHGHYATDDPFAEHGPAGLAARSARLSARQQAVVAALVDDPASLDALADLADDDPFAPVRDALKAAL